MKKTSRQGRAPLFRHHAVWDPKAPAVTVERLPRAELDRVMRSATPQLRRFIRLSLLTGTRHPVIDKLPWK